MVWVATAIIGGAVLSTVGTAIASNNASNAATQAANIQAQAANQAAQYQYAMYGQTRNDLLPFQNVGRSAIGYMNGLVPGGLNTGNPAQPMNSGVVGGGGGTPQMAGVDEYGNPVYVNVGGGGQQNDTTPMTFNGAAGGTSASGGQTSNNGSNPFLSAQLTNIPQLGGQSQSALSSFTPGTGTNPLQSALYSYVNGASGTPNPLLGSVNNALVGGSQTPNSLLGAVQNSVVGGSQTPNQFLGAMQNSILGAGGINNPALNNLTSFIPGANLTNNQTLDALGGSLANYNRLLGVGDPNPQAQKQLDSINSNFKASHDAWMKANPGRSEQDWAASDVSKNYNQNLTDFYKSNPSMVGEGIRQAGAQVDDPVYGASAKLRLEALNKVAANPQSAQQTALENTPGYKFALDQGLKATQNGFAAQGLASSGAAMKGGAQFAEGLASQTYNQQLQNYLQSFNSNLNNYNSQFQNAYNAYSGTTNNALNAYTGTSNNAYNAYNGTTNNALNAFNNQSNLAYNSYGQGFTNAFNMYGQQFNNANTGYTGQINNAQNLLALGSNAGAQTGTAGVQTANNAGGYLTSGAAAAAGGVVGSANALNNGIISGTNNFGNIATLYGMNPGMFSGGTGGVGNHLGGFQGYATPTYNI